MPTEKSIHHKKPESPTDRGRSPRKTFAVFLLVSLIIAFFIGRSVWLEWEAIHDYAWQLHYGWLLLAGIIIWVVTVLLIQLWRFLIYRVSGVRLAFSAGFQITVIANFGKYIPGKIWSMLGMVYLLSKEGIPPAGAFASTLLHQVFTLIAGAIFVIFVLGTSLFHGLPILPAILGIGFAMVLISPRILSMVLNRILRFLKREPLEIRLTFLESVGLLLVYVLPWILYGTAFWCLLVGLGITPESYWKTVATFGAAYLLGFLALFAPGGLGVREGVLTVLLTPLVPVGLAALVAVVARLWMTLVELSQLLPLIPRIKGIVAKYKNSTDERV